MKTLFEAFNSGTFVSPYDRKDFADLPWNPHPAFEGVTYAPGTMTILKKGTPHSVTAGSDGLLIFAKFFPPLC